MAALNKQSAGEITAILERQINEFGGILSPLALAYLVDATNNWNIPLMVLAGIYALAGIAWLAIDPGQRVEK